MKWSDKVVLCFFEIELKWCNSLWIQSLILYDQFGKYNLFLHYYITTLRERLQWLQDQDTLTLKEKLIFMNVIDLHNLEIEFSFVPYSFTIFLRDKHKK